MSRDVKQLPGVSSWASRDEGFTFAELLVALSLLLISLVAVAGLATTSSLMTANARQRSAMVNAAASYLERVRQLPYASIGTPSGVPTGTLLPSIAVNGAYTITITPVVIWGRADTTTVPPDYTLKTVTLSVSSVRTGGGSAMTYTTAAVFADVPTSSGSLPDRIEPSVATAPVSDQWGDAVDRSTYRDRWELRSAAIPGLRLTTGIRTG